MKNRRLLINGVCIFMACNAIRNIYIQYAGLSIYNGYEIFLSIVTFVGMIYILIIYNKPYYENN